MLEKMKNRKQEKKKNKKLPMKNKSEMIKL